MSTLVWEQVISVAKMEGKIQGCPQDVKSQDRDGNLQDRDETETFQNTSPDRSVAV